MGADFATKIEILRKQSRSLLNQVSCTSKIVENELQTLRKLKNNQLPRNNTANFHQTSSSWSTRNDSSEVHNLLHPGSKNLNGEMTVGRILITSKSPGVTCDPRKPVLGCYCRRAPRKVRYKSPNTVYRPWQPCNYCKTHFEVFEERSKGSDEILVSPALSSETLQRVQSIDYTPRSEFLQKVQKKVSQQFGDRREGNQSQISYRVFQNSMSFSRKSRKNQKNYENSEDLSNFSEQDDEIYDSSSNFCRKNHDSQEHEHFSIISQTNGQNGQIHQTSSNLALKNNGYRQNSTTLSNRPGNHSNHRHRRVESSKNQSSSSQNQRNSSQSIENIHEIEVINVQGDSTIVDPHPSELIEVPVAIPQVTSPTSETSKEELPSTTRIHKFLPKTSSTNCHQNERKSRNFGRTSQSFRDFPSEIETILPPRSSHNARSKATKTISSIKRDKHKKQQKNQSSERNDLIVSEKSEQNYRRKTSEKSCKNRREKSMESLREKSTNKIVRTLSQKSCQNTSCLLNERAKKKSNKSSKCDCCDRCIAHLTISPTTYGVDDKTLELRKFREKNYFDTHQSRHKINSCASSRSLDQFELNDRLFPESVGRINQDDVVVSMPPCVTSDFKRIHYFPRYIVNEDRKRNRGRHKSCPLTGHSIDLGLLKPPMPANSLALKYQKGIS